MGAPELTIRSPHACGAVVLNASFRMPRTGDRIDSESVEDFCGKPAVKKALKELEKHVRLSTTAPLVSHPTTN